MDSKFVRTIAILNTAAKLAKDAKDSKDPKTQERVLAFIKHNQIYFPSKIFQPDSKNTS